ncbi:MAG: TylF/MycF family methyltransferase [Oscillospiraceae bacterium]|nr:TylF/MycF family methyltransferase [Oscillospiraceae bacterium]
MYRKGTNKAMSRLHYHMRRSVKVLPGIVNRGVRRGKLTGDLLSSYWGRAGYVYSDGDYVRNASLELAAREICERGVAGAAAELGVFRGDYAKLINQAFPDRKLYLFDTFSGFDPDEYAWERQRGYVREVDDFSDTSMDLVLRKMKYPQNCVVKQGYFPDSAAGLDEQFAFVSIDCDLYQPTLAGLRFFRERLSPGGYIFVHDYQNPVYVGVKAAVRDFCESSGDTYFLLPDTCGSAVITRPY